MSGFGYFIEGFSLITKPGLRAYLIIPTLINVLVLVALFLVTYLQFDTWVAGIMSFFPEWMSFLYWLVWLIALLVVFFLLLVCFTFVANLIASPFNALLSIKVEEYLTGKPPTSEVAIWMILPRAVGREIVKLLYLLPRLLALLVITVIPVINVISPVLWILLGAWMMALQYADYGADNNDVSIRELRARLGKAKLQAILFGLPAYLLLTIPIVNLVLMPVGVAGGTKFWVEKLATQALPNRV